jgi:hypothetical protein
VLTRAGNGKQDDARTIINLATHTYDQAQFERTSASNGPAPNLDRSPSQVQRALHNGQVTFNGTATVNGTQAIALSIKVPPVSGARSATLALYVDAHTYQPLRTVTTFDGHPDLLVADWMPATPRNVAHAKADAIPAGYTKVNQPD